MFTVLIIDTRTLCLEFQRNIEFHLFMMSNDSNPKSIASLVSLCLILGPNSIKVSWEISNALRLSLSCRQFELLFTKAAIGVGTLQYAHKKKQIWMYNNLAWGLYVMTATQCLILCLRSQIPQTARNAIRKWIPIMRPWYGQTHTIFAYQKC